MVFCMEKMSIIITKNVKLGSNNSVFERDGRVTEVVVL